jgi:hypothetical protein
VYTCPRSHPPSFATRPRVSSFAHRWRGRGQLYGAGCFVGAAAGGVALTADDGVAGVQRGRQRRRCCRRRRRRRSLPLSWVLSSSGGEGGLGDLLGPVAFGSSSSLSLLLFSSPPSLLTSSWSHEVCGCCGGRGRTRRRRVTWQRV